MTIPFLQNSPDPFESLLGVCAHRFPDVNPDAKIRLLDQFRFVLCSDLVLVLLSSDVRCWSSEGWPLTRLFRLARQHRLLRHRPLPLPTNRTRVVSNLIATSQFDWHVIMSKRIVVLIHAFKSQSCLKKPDVISKSGRERSKLPNRWIARINRLLAAPESIPNISQTS